MNPPAHDGSMFLWAIGAIVAIVAIVIGLHRFARRPSKAVETAPADEPAYPGLAELERQREVERQRARAAEARARAELEQAVKEGRALPDGRIACHASAKCMLPAEHPAPVILRPSIAGRTVVSSTKERALAVIGWETQDQPNHEYRMTTAAKPKAKDTDEAPGGQDPNALFCDTHIHLARRVCLAKIAADEQVEQAQLMAREASVAAFQARLVGEVQRLVIAAEEQNTPSSPPPFLIVQPSSSSSPAA